jgi:glycosyltransferase involved in cell wall biosynthesis
MASRAPVVWGVHHSDHVAGVTKRSTLLTVSACACLSHHLPARVVCCSEHGRRLYEKAGFAASKLAVIPNGFDVETFRPDPEARASVRSELGLGPGTPMIGLVARYDPLKDHATFLRAAARLGRARPDVHFLLCGAKVDRTNAELAGLAESLGIAGRCHLLGPRQDVPRIFAALDVAASSSISEAFPLALGEAMACGVPCVATDVGDCALMIGPTGRVVPPGEPAALAAALADVLGMSPESRRALGAAARRGVVERFELGAVTRQYEDLYQRLASCAAPQRDFGSTSFEVSGGRIAYAGSDCAAS